MMGANLVLALIIGSTFYDPPSSTTPRAPPTRRQPALPPRARLSFYHPATEAAAGIVADIPVKFGAAVVFNLLLYFLAGLRREPG
ncbi:hypothetical protein B0T26DRAFT_750831 [Lasiosphaeria miniovina]|uniref:Uncharacterized protein n=1 Tax=Lasiosphaeria miniovina TaxID=1954250 RepID=A0AA40AX09_9PEZI|nr:uncharacterized protein B0T26DRAFT_750831 [Lasiosphaeria miniovina]KAK0723566.1 hypothetical protein B0T26DRAFT_750831 [Lasiosphaeria miniovina]